MTRRARWGLGLALVVGMAGVATWLTRTPAAPPARSPADLRAERIRHMLFERLQPVRLSNCEFRRFGEANDGGYLLCGNLLRDVRAAYSYGISGYDGWGCDLASSLGVPVHQYDCFDTTEPWCQAETTFHAACVGPDRSIVQGRVFDTLASQIAETGHAGSQVVVKMDVEGAEWDVFLAAPDAVLQQIDQLAIELHETDEMRFVRAVDRLKQFFHVANLHMNNFGCESGHEPFPSWAYEVLFVNKRLAQVDASNEPPRLSHPLDAPNSLKHPDCQPALTR